MGHAIQSTDMTREEAEKARNAIQKAHPDLYMTIDIGAEVGDKTFWHVAVVPALGGPSDRMLHQLAEEAVGRKLPESAAFLRNIPLPSKNTRDRYENFADRFASKPINKPER